MASPNMNRDVEWCPFCYPLPLQQDEPHPEISRSDKRLHMLQRHRGAKLRWRCWPTVWSKIASICLECGGGETYRSPRAAADHLRSHLSKYPHNFRPGQLDRDLASGRQQWLLGVVHEGFVDSMKARGAHGRGVVRTFFTTDRRSIYSDLSRSEIQAHIEKVQNEVEEDINAREGYLTPQPPPLPDGTTSATRFLDSSGARGEDSWSAAMLSQTEAIEFGTPLSRRHRLSSPDAANNDQIPTALSMTFASDGEYQQLQSFFSSRLGVMRCSAYIKGGTDRYFLVEYENALTAEHDYEQLVGDSAFASRHLQLVNREEFVANMRAFTQSQSLKRNRQTLTSGNDGVGATMAKRRAVLPPLPAQRSPTLPPAVGAFTLTSVCYTLSEDRTGGSKEEVERLLAPLREKSVMPTANAVHPATHPAADVLRSLFK